MRSPSRPFAPACCAASLPAQAQSGPPTTIVVATSAGTGVDVIARVLGRQLAAQMGSPVIVENRPGASGNIGADHVARAAADGRTLLLAATTFATNAAVNRTLPYDPVKSFVPISLLSTGAMTLAVAPTLKAESVPELVRLAKATPGAINYASPGNGTPQHLAMELFKLEAGVDLFHVPYKSTGGAVTDLAGGHISAMAVPIDTVLPLATGGKVKVLGVMSAQRFQGLPDVPTLSEQGLPKVEVGVWYGLLAPAGTPRATVDRLNREVNEALARPEVVTTLRQQGIDPAGGSPERLAAHLRAELARWQAVVKAARISVD